MSSRDEINPSECPSDSLDNISEDSHFLNLNPNAIFSTSAVGLSDLGSVSNDPNNKETAQYEIQNFQDENFVNPSDGLTKDTTNLYNPITDEHCYSVGRESSGQQFVSFQNLSNLLPLNESSNNIETSLNENLISKYETFTNASLPSISHIKDIDTEMASDKYISPDKECFESTNYNHISKSEVDNNSTRISAKEILPFLLQNCDSKNVDNLLFNSIQLKNEMDTQNSYKFNIDIETSFSENRREAISPNTVIGSSYQNRDIEKIFNHDNEGNLVSSEMNDCNDTLTKSYLSQTYIGETQLTDTGSIFEQKRSNLRLNHIDKSLKSNDIRRKSLFTSSGEFLPSPTENAIQQSITDLILRQNAKQKDNLRNAMNLPEIIISETETYQVKEMSHNSSSSAVYEDSYWNNLGPSTCTSFGNNAEDEKCDIKMTGISEESDSLNNKFASKIINLPEMPKINFNSTTNKDSCRVNFDPSICSGSGHSVPETEKYDLTTTDILKEIGTSNSKTFDMESAYNGEDCGSFEQRIFENSENCNLAVHPLSTEIKSFYEELGHDISAENILPQNRIEGNDVSDEERYSINLCSIVDENDSKLAMQLEAASNEINSDQEVDAYEIRQQNGGISITNCNIDIRDLNTVDNVERQKYQELKIITNNFFESYERSSLVDDQKMETLIEAETEIKTTNTPSLIRNLSSINKSPENHSNNLPSNNELENKILNVNKNLIAEISVQEVSTPIQGMMNSDFTNKSESKKDGNTEVILKIGVDNNKTYDFDNSNEELKKMYSSSTYEGSMNNNYNPQNNNELTANYKYEHQILNITDNSTSEISSSSEQNMVNSSLINEKEGNTTVFSKTGANNQETCDFENSGQVHQSISLLLNEFNYTCDNVDVNEMESRDKEWKFSLPRLHLFGTIGDSSKTLDETCLEKEEHQKNNTISSSNDTFLVKTIDNSDFNHILNTKSQNAGSASTSNLNSIQPRFMSIVTEERQKTDLSENMEDNFPVQESISDINQDTETINTDENTSKDIYIFESKQSFEIESSTVTNAIIPSETFINEQSVSENCNSNMLFKENICDKNPNRNTTTLGDTKARYSEAENTKTTDINKSESIHKQTDMAELRKNEGNSLSFGSHSIPSIVSGSNKDYFTENNRIDETRPHLESAPQEKNNSRKISDNCKDIIKKSRQLFVRLEDIKYKLIPLSSSWSISQGTSLQNLETFSLNLPKATCAMTTHNSKENNIGAEKQPIKRIASESQSVYSLKSSRKLKSCKMQPKSIRTTCHAVTIPTPEVKIKNQSINVRSSRTFLNSSNFNFNSTYAETTDNRNKNNAYTENQSTNRTLTEGLSPYYLRSSKKLKSCEVQPKSCRTTCQPVTKEDIVSTQNSQKTLISSDVRNTNEESISSPIFQMAEILRKFDNKRKETSTSNNDGFVFGPRKFIERKNDGNSSLLFGNSCEGTSTGNVFDCTVTAVKQLNNGNGSTVLDILSYVRTHVSSGDKKLSLDVRKALKDATAAGFLTYTNGRYKEGLNLIKVDISTKTNKRKTNRADDNSKMLSKRVKPTPTQLRSSRPKTTCLTNKKSGRNLKDNSREE